MRKRLTWTIPLGAALAIAVAGIATATKPTVVQVGKVIVTFNGGVSPKALPKNKLAPITFTVSGKVKTSDSTHLPALEEFVIEADRNSAIDAKGLPVCTPGKLEATTTAAARKACPTAIVGEGRAAAEVEFVEQPKFIVHSKLLAFNGGVKGGVTTLFVHAFLTSPVSAAIVTTVKVTKIHNGRYGLKSVSSIPKIAGGAGSVQEFTLAIKRKFTYKGKQQSYLLAKCPDGHLNAHGVAVFHDGTIIAGNVVRPCTPKG